MGSSPVVQSSGYFSALDGQVCGSVFGFVLMHGETNVSTICSRAEAVCRATRRLREGGIEAPRREARLLVAHALGITREALLREPSARADFGRIAPLAERRAAGVPLAHITGRREFWSLDFEVSPATLIPRPESETLIEAAISARPGRAGVHRILDLGTGTGCLLLAGLTEFPDAFGVGVDRVPEAAALGARNALRLGLAGRASFVCADWGQALAGGFDLVLSNPPYVSAQEMTGLSPEVRLYEPCSALLGGLDGLDAYRQIVADLRRLLRPDGMAVLEIGAGQANAVATIAHCAGFVMETRADLAGIARAAMLRPHEPVKKPFGSTGEGD